MELRPVIWVGSSKEDLKAFPADVQDRVGPEKGRERDRATPKQEIDLIKRRLKAAEKHYEDTCGKGRGNG